MVEEGDNNSCNGWTTASPSSLRKGPPLLPHPSNGPASFPACEPSPVSSSSSGFGGVASRASAASRIHCLAEKRRRERINAHLSTLRCMTPNSSKLDKATLLGKVIDQVKDLKRRASAISTKAFPVPKELNEVIVESEEESAHQHLIRVSICCEDRSGLYTDIAGALHVLKLRAVKADMASLGDRSRNVFLLCKEHSSGGDGLSAEANDTVNLSCLLDDIKESLGRFSSLGSASSEMPSKRRRLLLQPKIH